MWKLNISIIIPEVWCTLDIGFYKDKYAHGRGGNNSHPGQQDTLKIYSLFRDFTKITCISQ